MKKLLLILILLPISLYSQSDTNRNKYGIFIGYNYNYHIADFKRIPDCWSCSPGYKDGSGSGITLALVMDNPIGDNLFFSTRLIYKNISGKLTSYEPTTVIQNGNPVAGEFEHIFDSDLSVIGIEPALKYKFFDNFFVNFGVLFSFLYAKDYFQVERIKKPTKSGTFLDSLGVDTESRERNKFSGTLKSANIVYIAPMLSLSYQLPLDKKKEFILEPEAIYYYALTNIVTDALVKKWTVNNFTIGISIKYSPVSDKNKSPDIQALPIDQNKPRVVEAFKSIEIIDTVSIVIEGLESDELVRGITYSDTAVYYVDLDKNKEFEISSRVQDLFFDTFKYGEDKAILTLETVRRTDTLRIVKYPSLDGVITAVGVDSLGKEIPNPIFKIEEYIANRLEPLLNYVFFENMSSELPPRYSFLQNSETGKFEIDSLIEESTLDIYYHILNIVCKRLTLYPSANITLVGCNAGIGEEKGDTALSLRRAETVRDYLINVWNISPDRIKLEKRNLSSIPSIPIHEPDKIPENRRVELYSDNDKILEPVFFEKIDRFANPSIARFKASAKAEAGLKSWKIKAYQSSSPKNQFSAEGSVQIPANVDWGLEEFQKIIPKFPEPIIYSLELEDNNGKILTIENKTLPIEVLSISKKKRERIGSFEIDRYSLILFDFDKAGITGNNKKIIDFIKGRIYPESIIEIEGYTDRTGDNDHNKKLSASRASSTKNALNRPDATSAGIGEDRLLYNNEVPEGRFYCRTVKIVVKTKVE